MKQFYSTMLVLILLAVFQVNSEDIDIGEIGVFKFQEVFDDFRANETSRNVSYIWTELTFVKDVVDLKIDLLCRDESLLSFQLSSGEEMKFYIYEYSQNGELVDNDVTFDNFVVLDDLVSGETYQINVWAISKTGKVSGPYSSEPVATLDENYTPLGFAEFKLVRWELNNSTLFDAVVEWTPANDDKLCSYDIMIFSDKKFEADKFSAYNPISPFTARVPGFIPDVKYSLSISAQLRAGKIESKWISIETPNCLEFSKSIKKCVPNRPENVSVHEKVAEDFWYWYSNITYDITANWSAPIYKPNNYTVEIVMIDNSISSIVQILSGEATSVAFYNVAVTPHYFLKITSSSEAGNSDSLTLDRLIYLSPKMISALRLDILLFLCIFFVVINVANTVYFIYLMMNRRPLLPSVRVIGVECI